MYNVGVIGLGSISMGYGSPGEVAPYCHVGGILLSDRVRLAAVADLSAERREKFRAKWGASFPDVKYYDDAARMLADEKLDIVAVCVRGPHHFAVTKLVLGSSCRAIFLEKPPTCSLAELDELQRLAKAKSVPIIGSYSRHWAPHVLRLQELVAGGLIGDVESVVGYCGGLFLSFASHTTDLICQFAGYDPVSVIARGRADAETVAKTPPGVGEPEPSLQSMFVEFPRGVTAFQVGADGPHGAFYVEVFGTKGRARAGMYLEPQVTDAKGKPVDLAPLGIPANASVFTLAYGQIAAHLDGGPLPHCSNDAMRAVCEVGFGGIESALTGQPIALPNVNRTRKIYANG
ncbi:MAG: hypothetical protein JWM35_318 [Verrucomicrobia bacterium]|nr:hypothetical protein [Verrucomicrobiota bacterium]